MLKVEGIDSFTTKSLETHDILITFNQDVIALSPLLIALLASRRYVPNNKDMHIVILGLI